MSHETFRFIQNNGPSYSMMSHINGQKFWYKRAICFIKYICSRKFGKAIYGGQDVYFMPFFVVNWSSKINLCFLFQFSTRNMGVKLPSGIYWYRFLPITMQGLLLDNLTIRSLFMYGHQQCVQYIKCPGYLGG